MSSPSISSYTTSQRGSANNFWSRSSAGKASEATPAGWSSGSDATSWGAKSANGVGSTAATSECAPFATGAGGIAWALDVPLGLPLGLGGPTYCNFCGRSFKSQAIAHWLSLARQHFFILASPISRNSSFDNLLPVSLKE